MCTYERKMGKPYSSWISASGIKVVYKKKVRKMEKILLKYSTFLLVLFRATVVRSHGTEITSHNVTSYNMPTSTFMWNPVIQVLFLPNEMPVFPKLLWTDGKYVRVSMLKVEKAGISLDTRRFLDRLGDCTCLLFSAGYSGSWWQGSYLVVAMTNRALWYHKGAEWQHSEVTVCC